MSCKKDFRSKLIATIDEFFKKEKDPSISFFRRQFLDKVELKMLSYCLKKIVYKNITNYLAITSENTKYIGNQIPHKINANQTKEIKTKKAKTNDMNLIP